MKDAQIVHELKSYLKGADWPQSIRVFSPLQTGEAVDSCSLLVLQIVSGPVLHCLHLELRSSTGLIANGCAMLGFSGNHRSLYDVAIEQRSSFSKPAEKNADIRVLVKIESADSVPNLHSILDAADGVSVAGCSPTQRFAKGCPNLPNGALF